ncbi:hypothetical protein [Streptomyces sp. NPDC029674]|uniref:hypothetical protein n=1 Tax=Streptomyces sp. NPDC029674 TaxID=3365297 RepID=UPI00385026E1
MTLEELYLAVDALGAAVVVGQGGAASTAARSRSSPVAKERRKGRSAARGRVIQMVSSSVAQGRTSRPAKVRILIGRHGYLGTGVGKLVAQRALPVVEAVRVAGEQTGDLAGQQSGVVGLDAALAGVTDEIGDAGAAPLAGAVAEIRPNSPTERAAMKPVAAKLGTDAAETVRTWVRKVDTGRRLAVTSEEAAEIKRADQPRPRR